jgi:hypothetical protein
MDDKESLKKEISEILAQHLSKEEISEILAQRLSKEQLENIYNNFDYADWQEVVDMTFMETENNYNKN